PCSMRSTLSVEVYHGTSVGAGLGTFVSLLMITFCSKLALVQRGGNNSPVNQLPKSSIPYVPYRLLPWSLRTWSLLVLDANKPAPIELKRCGNL
ncbi:hypothetical protein, partial [Coleofasciculus sp.]|uniref:hypothetical protein n=1 Tax=Coleofasciculus sp. TaxID=3100458 RepID=UPI003A1733F5